MHLYTPVFLFSFVQSPPEGRDRTPLGVATQFQWYSVLYPYILLYNNHDLIVTSDCVGVRDTRMAGMTGQLLQPQGLQDMH